jgi:predicted enzyme related to lactoylglutathione lyase
MIRVKEIAFSGYPVTDIARARAFYEGLFGLKPSVTFEHEGRHWVEYEIGGATFAISNMAPEWRPNADGPVVALEMEDFQEAVKDLRAAGVRFCVEPTDTSVCWMAVVADPDGNSLMIHRRHNG